LAQKKNTPQNFEGPKRPNLGHKKISHIESFMNYRQSLKFCQHFHIYPGEEKSSFDFLSQKKNSNKNFSKKSLRGIVSPLFKVIDGERSEILEFKPFWSDLVSQEDDEELNVFIHLFNH